MHQELSVRFLDGEVKKIKVERATKITMLPKLLCMQIGKFESISIVVGDTKFSSGSLGDIPGVQAIQEVQAIKETNMMAISNALSSGFWHDVIEALGELQKMDPIPVNMVTEFIADCKEVLWRSWRCLFFAGEDNVLLQIVRLMGQKCENLDDVAETLATVLNDALNSHRIYEALYYYVMLFEIALRNPNVLGGAATMIAPKQSGELCIPLHVLYCCDMTQLHTLKVLKSVIDVFFTNLVEVVSILGDAGLGERILQDLTNRELTSVFSSIGSMDLFNIGVETLEAFVHLPEIDGPEAERLENSILRCPSIDDPYYENLEGALVDSDAATCHLLASKAATGESLSSFTIEDDLKELGKGGSSKSAPDRLQKDASSSRSSRLPAVGAQDVEVTSQVTPDPWERLEMYVPAHLPTASVPGSMTENFEKTLDILDPVVESSHSGAATLSIAAALTPFNSTALMAVEYPDKPPGVLQPFIESKCAELDSSRSFDALATRHAQGGSAAMHIEGCTSSRSIGGHEVSATAARSARGQGSRRTKNRNRRRQKRDDDVD
jgi:hypothetical protein